jgi:uroporphyrinogen-III decarboxylase
MIDAFCESTDRFVVASDLARPFERMHFIRGAENLFIDLALENKGMLEMLLKVHDFYCKVLEIWSKTKVDALFAMDDWGSQRSLLINPEVWRKLFKPLYRDYVDIAHKNGKKMLFHSDGCTLDIIDDLIDVGFDAANLQIFVIGIDKLKPFRSRMTFWGEIDRQHLLPRGTPIEIDAAVNSVYETLWEPGKGGAIAQCEFGPGANPANVSRVYEAWEKVF